MADASALPEWLQVLSVAGSPLAALGGLWLGSGLQERREARQEERQREQDERKHALEAAERAAERRRVSTVAVLEHLGTLHRIADQAFHRDLHLLWRNRDWIPLEDFSARQPVAAELRPALIKLAGSLSSHRAIVSLELEDAADQALMWAGNLCADLENPEADDSMEGAIHHYMAHFDVCTRKAVEAARLEFEVG